MDIREYFKDVIFIENIIKNENDYEKIIDLIQKSDYIKSLERELNILDNKKIDLYREDKEFFYKSSNRTFNLKVNFRITLGVRDKKIKQNRLKISHKHDCYELIYVYDGSYSQYIGEKYIKLKKGDACFLDCGVNHIEEPLGESDTVFFLCFSKRFLRENIIKYLSSKYLIEDFLNNYKENYIIFTKDKYDCNSIVKGIVKEYFRNDSGRNFILNGYIIRFLESLINSYKLTLISEDIKNKKIILFKEIEKYIEDNIKDISREKIANKFHYNSSYINRIIKLNTNLTYSEYVLNKKLDIFVKFLKNTDLSINKIIKIIGYTNKSYFYKVFISKYGVKPKDYRKILKNQL